MGIVSRICVRISNGRAVLVNPRLSEKYLNKIGLRDATYEEIQLYEKLKPLFEIKQIKEIIIGKK